MAEPGSIYIIEADVLVSSRPNGLYGTLAATAETIEDVGDRTDHPGWAVKHAVFAMETHCGEGVAAWHPTKADPEVLDFCTLVSLTDKTVTLGSLTETGEMKPSDWSVSFEKFVAHDWDGVTLFDIPDVTTL